MDILGTSPRQSTLWQWEPVRPLGHHSDKSARGDLVYFEQENAKSTARQKIELELQPMDELTVGDVINLFTGNNMHRYMDDSTGSGALFWL